MIDIKRIARAVVSESHLSLVCPTGKKSGSQQLLIRKMIFHPLLTGIFSHSQRSERSVIFIIGAQKNQVVKLAFSEIAQISRFPQLPLHIPLVESKSNLGSRY